MILPRETSCAGCSSGGCEPGASRSAPRYCCYLRSSCSPRLDHQHSLAETRANTSSMGPGFRVAFDSIAAVQSRYRRSSSCLSGSWQFPPTLLGWLCAYVCPSSPVPSRASSASLFFFSPTICFIVVQKAIYFRACLCMTLSSPVHALGHSHIEPDLDPFGRPAFYLSSTARSLSNRPIRRGTTTHATIPVNTHTPHRLTLSNPTNLPPAGH